MEKAERVAALTEIEAATLREYLQTSDPKLIARKLGVSVHTVEQRLARARRRLGVNRTIDAAHYLAEADGNPVYQTAIYAGETRGPGLVHTPPPGPSEAGGVTLPVPTRGRPWNALPSWQRLAWMTALLVLASAGALLVVALQDAVSRIVR